MAFKSVGKCMIFATLMLFVSSASGEHDYENSTSVCTRTLYRRAPKQESFVESYSMSYGGYRSCGGWLRRRRCATTYYNTAYRAAYRTAYYSQAYDQDYCCPGYIGTAPHCQRGCPSPSLIVSNGAVIVNSTLVGDTASYSCNPGYAVDGAAVLTCQMNSSWNNEVPTCRRACPVLEEIADGAVSKTDGDFIGSEGSSSCSYGYGMVGEPTLTCMSSGEWNKSPPECYKLILCPRLDDPTNGIMTLENRTNGVDSRVSYRCSAGYALVGSGSRTCQLNGIWTHSDPQCERICPTLRPPQDGYMTVSDYFVAGTANFVCHVGFGMFGSGQITCEADGFWSQQPPVCNPVCPVPTKPDNVIVSDGPHFIESNVTFACEEGFGVNGNPTITCLSDLTWSGSSPTCDRVCGPPKQVLSSTVNIDSYFYNGEATYQCIEGFVFKFSGFQTDILTFCCLHAQDSDHLLEWVGDHDVVPDCERIECSTRRLRLRYGTFTVTSKYYGGIVTYKCSDGYKLSRGPRIRRCSSESIWEPRISPSCTEVPGNCSSLQQITAPVNGEVSITSHLYGGSALYKCNVGFTLVGGRVRSCTEGEGGGTVTWSGSEPQCLTTEPDTE